MDRFVLPVLNLYLKRQAYHIYISKYLKTAVWEGLLHQMVHEAL